MPWLIAFKGDPGTGKSTISRALSASLGWPLIDKDDIKDILDQRVDEAGALAYGVMLRLVRRQLLQGLDVICDSPFLPQTYLNARRIADETRTSLVVIECRCSDETMWRRRIEARQNQALPHHHTTTWDDLQAARRRRLSGSVDISEPLLTMDTTRSIEQELSDIIEWLDALGVDTGRR
jgi:predicted kinase